MPVVSEASAIVCKRRFPQVFIDDRRVGARVEVFQLLFD